MGMQGYAPKVSSNIMSIADQIEAEANSNTTHQNEVLEVLIDAWVSGRIVRIVHSNKSQADEETELAPYFIGFVETESGRNPVTVTGRLRHTTEIITLDISQIKSVSILNETYTIPDNLKAFRRMESPASPEFVVDTIPLILSVKQKSALNSFDTLSHGKIETEKMPDGSLLCSFEAENSIELILRIIQCGDSVEIIKPEKFRRKFLDYLQNILKQYK